jgi:hypothetical protein
MSEEYRNLLLQAFPESSWPVLTRGIREAIKIADGVRLSTPFLTTQVGGDLRGHLRRAALMWRIQMLCESKEVPFEANEITNPYTNGTSHLLSIRSNKIELHIVRTEEAKAFPVGAQIRQDCRASNEADLFRDGKLIPIDIAISAVPQLYGWLMWGATASGELTHFSLGMPEHQEDRWLTYVDVLTRITAMEVASGTPAEEAPSKPNPALMLKFREEIARSLGQGDIDQGLAGNDE